MAVPAADPLTAHEAEIVDRLGEIYSDISLVVGEERTRMADLTEAAAHVHALQAMVLAQAAARVYPGKYRLLGETLR